MEGLKKKKKTTASAQLIRVFEILIYQIKWLSSKKELMWPFKKKN